MAMPSGDMVEIPKLIKIVAEDLEQCTRGKCHLVGGALLHHTTRGYDILVSGYRDANFRSTEEQMISFCIEVAETYGLEYKILSNYDIQRDDGAYLFICKLSRGDINIDLLFAEKGAADKNIKEYMQMYFPLSFQCHAWDITAEAWATDMPSLDEVLVNTNTNYERALRKYREYYPCSNS